MLSEGSYRIYRLEMGRRARHQALMKERYVGERVPLRLEPS